MTHHVILDSLVDRSSIAVDDARPTGQDVVVEKMWEVKAVRRERGFLRQDFN